MKTQDAITKAGSAKDLADLLKVTPGAVSQWKDEIPELRVWQLRAIKPEWFVVDGAPEASNQGRITAGV